MIGPQPGPQTDFLASDADIAILGGAAGGGKTYAAVLAAAQWYDRRGYAAIIFRRTAPELVGGGSVWETSQSVYRVLGGEARTSPTLAWRFPSGAQVEMRHLQHEDDVYAHQGKAYACIVFEELTHFTERQFWYLLSRARSTCGVRPHVRATCNPDPDSFVRRLLDWWIGADGYAIPERAGKKRWMVRTGDSIEWFATKDEARAVGSPMSVAFFPAVLADNKLGDPSYRERLEALPLVERRRLLDANWDVRTGAGTVFKREWFRIVDAPPVLRRRTVRAWDKAATEPTPSYPDPDWTRGALVSELDDGSLLIEHMAGCRRTPGGTMNLITETADRDGRGTTIALWQDPGQAGVVDVDVTASSLLGWPLCVVKAATDKLTSAQAWSTTAERGRVFLLRGPWNADFLAEAERFPDAAHDDQVDAVSLAVQALSRQSTGSVSMPDSTRMAIRMAKPWGSAKGNKPW